MPTWAWMIAWLKFVFGLAISGYFSAGIIGLIVVPLLDRRRARRRQ